MKIYFNKDWKTIKCNLVKNQYPEKLLSANEKNFLEKNKSVQKDIVTLTAPKNEITMILPLHGKQSDILQKRLVSLFNEAYHKFVWKSFSALLFVLAICLFLKIRYL